MTTMAVVIGHDADRQQWIQQSTNEYKKDCATVPWLKMVQGGNAALSSS
jgi:hypothetical protein